MKYPVSFLLFLSFAFATTLAIAPENLFALRATCFLGTAAAVAVFLSMIENPSRLKFTNLIFASLGVGYLLTSLLAIKVAPSGKPEFLNISLAYSTADLSYAIIITITSMITLHIGSIFEKPINVDGWRYELEKPQTLFYSATLFFIFFALIAHGDIGYMGAQRSEDGGTSALGILSTAIGPLVMIIISGYIFSRNDDDKRRVISVILLIFAAIAVAILGRRSFFYAIATSALIVGVHGHRINASATTIIKFGAATATIAISSYFIFYGFIAVRLATWVLPSTATTLDLLNESLDILTTTRIQNVYDYAQATTRERQFILSYFAGFLHYQGNAIPSFGDELRVNFLISVPSILFPGKSDAIPRMIEDLTHPALGFPVFDGPNSFLVSGYFDFSVPGSICYPIAVAFLLSFACRLIAITNIPTIVKISVATIFIFQSLQTETSISAVIASLRNSLIMIALFYVVSKSTKIRLISRKYKLPAAHTGAIDSIEFRESQHNSDRIEK